MMSRHFRVPRVHPVSTNFTVWGLRVKAAYRLARGFQ